MSRPTRDLFQTIRSEGGLLPPELLKRIVEGDSELPGMAPADYHLEEGARLSEAVTRSWNRLRGGLQGEIGIVELRGTLGSAPANDRQQGFAEAIASDRRYRIIRSQSADFDGARARELMAEFLAAEGRRIRVLFAHSDTMALSAIEAIEAAGIKPGSEILVISIEGKREALEAIVAGRINVSVECSPLLGPQLMAVVKEAAAGKPVPRRVITQETVFTRENAAAELPKRVY